MNWTNILDIFWCLFLGCIVAAGGAVGIATWLRIKGRVASVHEQPKQAEGTRWVDAMAEPLPMCRITSSFPLVKGICCPNCASDADPVKNYNGDVVGCEECFATMREWCEIGQHWVHEGDARSRWPRSMGNREGSETPSCVGCEAD